MKKEILLVEPDFPYPKRSKNHANEDHKNFAPIGLLKLGAMHKSLGDKVKLVRGNVSPNELKGFIPDMILVTSIFTYWSRYVWDSIGYYRSLFPSSRIILGGIYATLHKDNKEFLEKVQKYRVKVYTGVHKEAEKFLPDYSLLKGKIDHHITHAMRGCIRRCAFCGTWKIEPELKHKTAEQLVEELKKANKNKVIFFDNNFLANPDIRNILIGLAELRLNGNSVSFESQSGFDGRLLEKDPELAILLKKARFSNIRIAWDNGLEDAKSIKKQISYLTNAGFSKKDIYVFMIYNFNRPYEDMLKKLKFCKGLGVQIADCRYRPLNSTYDNYQPHKFREGQTKEDYYIHELAGWTDKKIREFRKRVRQHNMTIRYADGKDYNKDMERWSAIHNTYKFFNLGPPPLIKVINKSKALKNKVRLLNRLKNYYKEQNIPKPFFKDLTKTEINDKIDKLIGQYSLNV